MRHVIGGVAGAPPAHTLPRPGGGAGGAAERGGAISDAARFKLSNN